MYAKKSLHLLFVLALVLTALMPAAAFAQDDGTSIYIPFVSVADGRDAVREVSMAKNFATRVSDRVTSEAVQIFGGSAYMRESVVERLYRDNRILSIGGGTYEIMNELIAKQLGL